MGDTPQGLGALSYDLRRRCGEPHGIVARLDVFAGQAAPRLALERRAIFTAGDSPEAERVVAG